MGFGSRLKKLFKSDKKEKEEFESQNGKEDNEFDVAEEKSDTLIDEKTGKNSKQTPEVKERRTNFEYLDAFIHSGAEEIVLNSDITLDDDEGDRYGDGIRIDLDNIVIDGDGHTIDANNKARIFHVTAKNITIKNIILKNGHIDNDREVPSKSEGGLILVENGELHISNSKLTDSSAKWGGAIFNRGRLDITDSTLSHNASRDHGGAIFNEGHLNILDSSISNNKSEQSKGGAIFNIGTLNIKGAELSDNSSDGPQTSGGGAIYSRGDLNIDDSIFTNNSVNGPNINTGGAIDNWENLTIVNSILSNNTSKRGGAIRNGKHAKIFNCRILENSSPDGIVFTDETMEIRDTLFSQNSSSNIVFNKLDESDLDMTQCEFKNNEVWGSVIRNEGKTCIDKSIFESNLSEKDSQNMTNTSELTLIKPEIRDDGRTVLNERKIIIKDTSLDILSKIHGPGIVVDEGGKILEEPLSEEERKRPHVACDSETFEKLIRNKVKNIELGSDLAIGGMEIYGHDITVDGKGHTIYGRGSKGIFEISGKSITFKNTTFAGGEWGGNGREAKKNSQRTSRVEDLNFYYYGGAIYVPYSGDCTFVKCDFINNIAGNPDRAKINRINVWYEAKGGAIYSNGTCKLISCNFRNNKAINGNFNDFYGCDEAKPTDERSYLKEMEKEISDFEEDFISVKTLYKGNGTDDNFTVLGKIESDKPAEGHVIELINRDTQTSSGQIPVSSDGMFMLELSAENRNNCYEMMIYDSNNDPVEVSPDCPKTITYHKIDDSGISNQPIPQNFKYLDGLIYFGEKEITLDCDIILEDDEEAYYGDGILIDADNITIEGNGHSISAERKARIFKITGQNATLKDITLKNGNAADGGAIYNLGTMTLQDSALMENIAKYGGAIRNNNGEVTLTNNTFAKNSASWFGGAIHNDNGTTTLQDNTFIKNKAEYYGGAISNWGKFKTRNDKYIENDSADDGGAIYNSYDLEIHDCEFSDNCCTNNIIFNTDILEIRKTQFNLNDSKEIISNIGDNAHAYAYDCKFKGNTVENSVIYNEGKSCNMDKSVFDNDLTDYSKNIINQTELTLKDAEIAADSKSILNNGYMLISEFPQDIKDKIEGEGKVEIIEKASKEERFDFGYLDKLIHESEDKKIVLEEDITFETYEKDFYEGGIELDIDGLTIDGQGKTIDGIDKSRIFIITGNDITLKNIIFKNGRSHKSHHDSANNHGGAVKINNENTVTIKNCEFLSNASEDGGGAISNEKGELTIKDTEICTNKALNGGAIRNGGTSIISGSTLNNNQSSVDGGTIYNKGSLTIKDSTLKENTSKEYGGAIHNDTDGNMTITNTTLEDNSASKDGGMIINFGETTIKESDITGNRAKYGGAIDNRGTIIIDDSTLHYNHADNDGGSIYNKGNMTIKDSTLSGSTAKKHGGCIHNASDGNMTITNTTLKENTVEGTVFSFGYIKSYGGAINNEGTLTIKDSLLTKNEAQAEFHTGATLTADGGAINNNGTLTIDETALTENTAREHGGAINNERNGKLTVTHATFLENESWHGGAIRNDGGDLTVDSTILDNNHSKFSGGAIETRGTCTINKSRLNNNHSDDYGGAIYGSATIKDSEISENTAEWGGGAIYAISEENLKIENCEMHNNNPSNIFIKK